MNLKKVFKSDLGKSISSGYLLFFMNNIVALFLTPYILKFVTKEEYGLYVLCVDFLAWVAFLEFGTNKVIESKAGHLIAKGDTDKLNKVFNASLFFQVLVAILIFPLFYTLLIYGIDKPTVPYLPLIIIVFSISASLSVFKSLFSATIIASKKIHLDNRIQFATNVLNYLLILLLVPFVGVLGMALITLLTTLIMLYRSNYRVKKLFPEIKISFQNFHFEELKELFSLGIYFSLGSIATLFLTKIDSFVIGREFGLEQVAAFYITVKLFMLTQKVFQMFLNNFRPHVSQLYGANKYDEIIKFYTHVTPIVLFLGAFSVAFVLFINPFFVELWVGESFYLSDDFSLLFGVALILELFTLLARIILIPCLFHIKAITLIKFVEGIARISFLMFFYLWGNFTLLIIPISTVVVSYILGVVFFYVKMKHFSDNFNVELNNNRIDFIYITSIVLLLLLFYNQDIQSYFKYFLLISSILGMIFLIRKNRKEFKKSLSIFIK
ncbi:MAG: oligosaccharide flippase family protein [Crocinitomicaceae bacterium]|nr:oligosaccharide flippase family protein [Crocinitomicaceae bacterium]